METPLNQKAKQYRNTSMMDLIHKLWFLKRDLVSDDYNQALFRLAEEVPMVIHEYPTGEPCWTWTVPEKWTCHAAYLETLEGQRLIDYADHPLHVVSYSLPFEGVVNRDELFKHLHVHPHWPDAIPYAFNYYQRDWGLCMSQDQRDTLTDEAYRVVIRTTFEPGMLKVGEVIIPGASEETFIFVAHLCHPAMVSDDLSGVVLGVDVARKLLSDHQANRRYTYRYLIVPETIGSLAYLSHNEHLIPKMVGGLFLESLGVDSPHALQQSFAGMELGKNLQPDRCMATAIRYFDPQAFIGPYRSVVKNDEAQFNAPGVRVPMLSISRAWPQQPPSGPFYYGYHSSHDTPEIVSVERLEASRDLVLGLVDAWEKNQYVVNDFKGEVFCSKYGIWVDYRANPEGWQLLFRVMEYCDGEHTVADIAVELDASFQAVWSIIAQLEEKGLVWLSPTPLSTHPRKL